MSKVLFENFLAHAFCDFFSAGDFKNNKFHYICPNNDHAQNLFIGFESLGVNEINIKGALIKYVSINDQKILIMRHDFNEKNSFTYHEDFIATIRDELNSYPGYSLLIIHNSTLDTILTTSSDLSSFDSVFTNENIERKLLSLISESEILINLLIKRRSKIVKEENGSIFSFRNIYQFILSKKINLQDEGLFEDERLYEISNARDLSGAIKENEKIYNDINHIVNNYDDLNLSDQLEDMNLSESFIKENFPSNDMNKWQRLSFAAVQDEISKNKNRVLELYDVQVNGEVCKTFKHMSDKGPGNKHISILAEIDGNNDCAEVKLIFSKGIPVLSKEDFSKVQGCTINIHNSENKSFATLSFDYKGGHDFYLIKLSRSAAKEQYKFNILVLPKGFLNLSFVFNRIYIQSNKNKNLILLEYGNGDVDFNLEQELPSYVLSEQNEYVIPSNLQKLSYKAVIEEVDTLFFRIGDGNVEIPVQIIGSQTDDGIVLPTILDPIRYQSIFSPERIPQFKSSSRKVILAGRERGLNVDVQNLCSLESDYITSKLIYADYDNNHFLSLDDIDSSKIREAYKRLYSWLSNKNTIISLTNWPLELVDIVEDVVNSVIQHLDLIEDGALTEQNKNILKIGFSIIEGKEWITPLHPLCLAYCLELINNFNADISHSFKKMADITLNRLNPAGLLPIVSNGTLDYFYTVAHTHNPLWIELVPQRESNYSYVAKVFLEKIEDFISCFESIFIDNKNKSLIINSVNHNNNNEIFHGIVMYLHKYKEKAHLIHINIYNESLAHTKFDCFSEEADIQNARKIISIHDASFGLIKNIEHCDEIIYLFREKITFSKFTNDNRVSYSHLTFYKNNESVSLQPTAVDKTKSGISCGGLISGEASYLENGVYYTGYGTKGISNKNKLIEVSSYFNQLLGPARSNTTKYNKGIISVLAVNENFKISLEQFYKNSIWTCIIDPKVTLDFFGNGKTILIHYSDKYTSSNSYDAITVTENIELYKSLLGKESDGLINSFNAINGQWLLNIIRDASVSSTYTKNQEREKKSIVAAYKLISSLFFKSDATWVPISIGEMLRVARNSGLSLDTSDFSAVFNNYRGGPLSDDLLFVGFKDGALFLLPIEVKAREKGSDASKALRQLSALVDHLSELLSENGFKSKILKSLFIQQVYSQVERYKLYKIYPLGYFDSLDNYREVLIQGEYSVLRIDGFYESMIIEFNNSLATVSVEVESLNEGKTAHITLPLSFFDFLHNNPIEELSEKLGNFKNYPSLASCIFKNSCISKDELKIIFHDTNEQVISHEDKVKQKTTTNERIAYDCSNDVSSIRIFLGKSIDIQDDIYWEYGASDLSNRHMAIFGSSGQGKTYCIQALLFELSRHNCNSVIVDYTNGFLSEHLEKEFVDIVRPKSHVVAHTPLEISPFRKQVSVINGLSIQESDYIVASRIATAFKKIFTSTGDQQVALLTSTIEEGICLDGSDFSFSKLYFLLNTKGKLGETIANKLSGFIKSNLFSSSPNDIWSEYLKSNDVNNNIIQLATIPSTISTIAIEFILWDLYAYASSFGNKNTPIPIVLDEVQNLNLSLQSPLGKMLTEGRKYGISLMLATQTLSAFSKDDQDRLFLAAHKLFFSPAETELNTYSKILEQAVPGSNRKEWSRQLINLNKGQCISVGIHKDQNGVYKYGAIIISISSLLER